MIRRAWSVPHTRLLPASSICRGPPELLVLLYDMYGANNTQKQIITAVLQYNINRILLSHTPEYVPQRHRQEVRGLA